MAPVPPSLLVFLKYPAAGKVKTRLGTALGMDKAAQLYRQWIEQILQQIQPLRPQVRIIALYEGAPWEAFAPWHHLVDLWWVQGDGHLGHRLAAAFQQAQLLVRKETTVLPDFPSGQWQDSWFERAISATGLPNRIPVCAIGTDCLELDVPLLQKSFDLLQQHDVVIGPTYDGGYYLIGTATFRPDLFDNVRWSSPWTLEDQVRQCHALGCSVVYLPPRSDIDTIDDWQAYCQRCQSPSTSSSLR
jgi:glycosyltransferase A (GT-A) superfamily protein (DUF2064 family)